MEACVQGALWEIIRGAFVFEGEREQQQIFKSFPVPLPVKLPPGLREQEAREWWPHLSKWLNWSWSRENVAEESVMKGLGAICFVDVG